MLTRTSSSVAKTKMLVLLPLALACVLCFSKTGYSQSAKEGKRTVIPFGVTDTAKLITVTYDQILSNPRLVCTEPGCEVTGFEFSYLLSSGADPYRGPFIVNGNELTDHLKALLADVNKSDSSKTRMFIENIRMTRNGKEETVAPIVLRARAK